MLIIGDTGDLSFGTCMQSLIEVIIQIDCCAICCMDWGNSEAYFDREYPRRAMYLETWRSILNADPLTFVACFA